MLAFCVDLRSRQHRWTFTDGRFHGDAGTIQPFANPCITVTADQLCPHTFDIHLTSADGDSLRLETRPGRVRVTAGTYATAPVFVALVGTKVIGSWRIADVARLLPPWQLVDRHIARLLTRQQRYSADTPIEGLSRLTAGTTATADLNGLSITYPEPVPRIAKRRELRAGVDPVSVLDRIMKTTMAPYTIDHAGTLGVELSGGADSANVALTARTLIGPAPLYSFGLAMPRPDGELQAFRRALFKRRMDLTDYAIPAEAHLPFNPHGRRFAGPHDPASSYYCEAFDALSRTAAQHGMRVMLTGFGADEVMQVEAPTAEATSRIRPWLSDRTMKALEDVNTNVAPPTHVSASTLMTCASHSPAYLDAGIWPVAPFANPNVARFARQLPTTWAANKAVLRTRLTSAGVPGVAARPAAGEDFTPIMQHGMRAYAVPLLAHLLDDLVLADLGYVERNAVRQALAAAQSAPVLDSALVDLLRLEVGLRSLWETPS
jgi:asparagine synthase (glutamine-hydrolysing)